MKIKRTHLFLYHPLTCARSYLNHAGWGPWVKGEGMSKGGGGHGRKGVRGE